MPLSREKLNDLHELGRLLESLTSSAYSLYLLGQEQAAGEIVGTVEDLVEDTKGVVEGLRAPPP
ncbi:hypothetical protein LCGC14_0767960 [marine sediment metagenome]|uniref:Uncharacterized protein n=1 Tax=marine sediment metagenome TaxID=412755 RepID=A0A0F9PZ84_9ZZZZ